MAGKAGPCPAVHPIFSSERPRRKNARVRPGSAVQVFPSASAHGKLAEGEDWIQESILGSTFTGRFRRLDRTKGEIEPIITGSAHVNGEAKLLLNEIDPFCWGIRT